MIISYRRTGRHTGNKIKKNKKNLQSGSHKQTAIKCVAKCAALFSTLSALSHLPAFGYIDHCGAPPMYSSYLARANHHKLGLLYVTKHPLSDLMARVRAVSPNPLAHYVERYYNRAPGMLGNS